jgi:hypothetical protein
VKPGDIFFETIHGKEYALDDQRRYILLLFWADDMSVERVDVFG